MTNLETYRIKLQCERCPTAMILTIRQGSLIHALDCPCGHRTILRDVPAFPVEPSLPERETATRQIPSARGDIAASGPRNGPVVEPSVTTHVVGADVLCTVVPMDGGAPYDVRAESNDDACPGRATLPDGTVEPCRYPRTNHPPKCSFLEARMYHYDNGPVPPRGFFYSSHGLPADAKWEPPTAVSEPSEDARDAARYRWLRDTGAAFTTRATGEDGSKCKVLDIGRPCHGLDEAVDSAMNRTCDP